MRRFLHRPYLAVGLLTASSSFSFGCAENESMLFIGGVMAPEPPECVFTPDSGATMLLSGSVDPALTDTYRGVLLVGNQLTRRGSTDQLRTESARVSVEGTEVHVLTRDGNELASYTVPASGDIRPASGQEAGYGAVGTDLVYSVERYIGRVVVVDVQVYGKTLGGQDVESNWFSYPIHVLRRGALIDYPMEAMSGSDSNGAAQETSSPCFAGQDGVTTCTECSAPECLAIPGPEPTEE
jgi:hypothetical protein